MVAFPVETCHTSHHCYPLLDISRVCYLGYGGWLNAEWLWVFSVPPLGIIRGKPGFFLFSFGGSIMGFFEKLYGITRIRPPERANLRHRNSPVRHTNSPHPLGSGAPTMSLAGVKWLGKTQVASKNTCIYGFSCNLCFFLRLVFSP